MAHAIGVTVEGELGCLGSLETMKGDKEDGHGAEGTMTKDMLLTNPDQAADLSRRGASKDSERPGQFIDELEKIVAGDASADRRTAVS